MANDKVSVVFEALVGSTTKSTFQTLTKGFQDFAKGLRQSAKELSKMQQTQAADALGHVAMQVEKLSGSLSKMGQGTSKAKTQLQSLENSFKTLLAAEGKNAEAAKQVMETYKKGGMTYKQASEELNRLNTAAKITAQSQQFLATESAQVNAKWKQLIPSIKAGNTSFNQAVARAKNFGKAIQNVRIAIKEGGGSLSSFEKGLEQLNVADVKAANGLKLVGSSFKFLNAQGYKTLGMTNQNAEAVRKHTQTLTTYEKILNQTGVQQTKLREALTKVGNRFQNNQMRVDAYAQNLYKAEKAVTSLTGGLQQNSSVSSKALQNIDRMGVATQVEAQNLKIVSNGFKVLNNEGLKPFGNLSLEAAGKLKMLGTGFDTLVSKEKSLSQITGKTTTEIRAKTTAMWEAGKSIQQINAAHQKEITSLNKSVGQYEKMKQAASNLRQTYSDSLKPLNALNTSQKESQRRMKLWIAQIAKGKGDLKAMTTAIRQEAKSFQEQSKAINASKKAARTLSTEYASLLKTTDNLTVSQKKNVNRMQGWINVLAKGKGDASLLSKQVKQAAVAFNTEAKAIERSKQAHTKNVDSARQLATQYSSLVTSTRKVTTSSQTVNKAQQKLKEQAVALIREVKKGNKTFGYARAKLQEMKKGYTEAATKASLFEKAISKLANSLKTYGSYMVSSQVLMGVANAFRTGTQAVIEHDQALHNLKAIMNATNTETRTLDQTMLDVAQSTKFSIAEVGQAMVRFGQAGFTASEAVAGMQDIASLATGTLESLEETVNLVATGVRVFRLEMDQTSMVADVFANAVNNSRLTLHKLNIAFNYIGPLAKSAGLSLKDTAASLQLLANAGVRASTTGTGLRRVISGLLNPSTALAESIKSAGYQVDDFNPLLHDFSTIIGRLPDVVSNAGDAVEMFGLRGSAVVSAFATQGVSEFNRLRLGLNETGAASRMAEEQMKGLQNMLKNVSDKFGVLASTLVRGGILDGIKAFINLIRGTLTVLTTLADNTIGRLVVSLGSLTVAFLGVTNGVRALLKLNIVGFFQRATTSTVAFIGTILQAKGVAAATTVQVTSLGAAFTILKSGVQKASAAFVGLLMNPVSATLVGISVAITGVVTALSLYEKHLKKVQEEQNHLAGGLNTTISSFENFQKMVEEYGVGSNEATDAAKTLRVSAKKLGETHEHLSDTTDKLTGAINEETGVLLENSDALKKYTDTLKAEYLDAVTNATDATVKLYEKQRFVSNTLGKFKTLLSVFGKWLEWWLIGPFKLAGSAIEKFGSILGTFITEKFPKLRGAVEKVGNAWSWFVGKIGFGVNTIQEAEKEWSSLQKAMEEGSATDKEAERFKELSKNAERTAKAIIDSEQSLQEYLKAHDNLEPMAIIAIKDAFSELTKESNEAAQSIEKQFGSIVKSLQKEVAAAAKEGASSIEEMTSLFENHVDRVTQQAYIMYKAETDLWNKQLGEYANLRQNQEQADSRYLERLKTIYLEMYSAYKGILDKQKAYLNKTYSLELQNLSAFFENRKSLVNSGYEQDRVELEKTKQAALNSIRERTSSELEMEREVWNAKNFFFQENIKKAEQHSKELIRLANERFEAEKNKAELFINKEEEKKQSILELDQETYDAKIDSLESLEAEYSNYIDALQEKEKSLTKKIKDQIEERESFQESLAETIRNLEWKTLDDVELAQAKKTRAYELGSKARAAAQAGEFETAKEFSKKGIEAWKDYAGTLDESSENYKLNMDSIRYTIEDLGDVWITSTKKQEESTKKQKKNVEEQLTSTNTKLKETQGKIEKFNNEKAKMESLNMEVAIGELDLFSKELDRVAKNREVAIEFISSLEKKPLKEQINILSTEMSNKFEKRRKAFVRFEDQHGTDLKSAIQSYRDDLEKDTSSTHTVYIKKVSGGDSSESSSESSSEDAPNPSPGLRTGGSIPGYGGGDTVPAMLEKGEFVIRKEAVKKYGDDFLSKVNQGVLNKIPGFASGGRIGGFESSFDKIGGSGSSFNKEVENLLKNFYQFMNDNVFDMSVITFNASMAGKHSPYVQYMGGHYDHNKWLTEGTQKPDRNEIKELIPKVLSSVASAYETSPGSYTKLKAFLEKLKTYGLTLEGNYDEWPRFEKGGFIKQFLNNGGAVLKNARDTIPAMLEPGEFVITKDAVSKYGKDFMERINEGMFSNLKGFSAGGMVENTVSSGSSGSSVGERHEVVLNVGGNQYSFEGDKTNVQGFLNEIKRAKGAV